LSAADAALFELPVETHDDVPEMYRFWKIVQDPDLALFDRKFRPAWDGARRILTASADNPSILDAGAKERDAWLAEHKVALIVSRREAISGAWTTAASEGPFHIFSRK
jgi:hypothetical protein